jgi:hypothetical protein
VATAAKVRLADDAAAADDDDDDDDDDAADDANLESILTKARASVRTSVPPPRVITVVYRLPSRLARTDARDGSIVRRGRG